MIEVEKASFNLYGTVFDAEKVVKIPESTITIKLNESIIGKLFFNFAYNFVSIEVVDKNYSGLLYTLCYVLERKMKYPFDPLYILENEYPI